MPKMTPSKWKWIAAILAAILTALGAPSAANYVLSDVVAENIGAS